MWLRMQQGVSQANSDCNADIISLSVGLAMVLIKGAFCQESNSVAAFESSSHTLLIVWFCVQGGNIGVTPFISILRKILTNMELNRCFSCGEVSILSCCKCVGKKIVYRKCLDMSV